MANSNWVPQEDGTHLPSAELIEAVRANPDQYPNAVDDFSALSGKSKDEVQQILNHKTWNETLSPYYLGAVGTAVDTVQDVRQGINTGLQTAANKVGDLIIDGDNPDVVAAREEGQASIDAIDPKFDTQKGIRENVAETVGQAVPAITAGVTGGLVAQGVKAGVVGHLTFEDEDNLVQLTDEITGGMMPGFLVINETDDDTARGVKSLAANLVSEFALVGAGHAIAKVYRLMRPSSTPVTREALEEIAEGAGVELKEVAPEAAEAVTKKAQQDVTDMVDAPGRTADELAAEVKTSATAENAASIAAREAGEEVTPYVAPDAVLKKFRGETMGALDATLKRSSQVNTGKRAEIAAFRAAEDGRDVYVRQSDAVVNALASEQYDEALKLINDFSHNVKYDATWKNSVLKASLQRIEDNFDDIILTIRDDPTLRTRAAWKSRTSDLFDAKLKMAEEYRETGSSASYALLNRQLGITTEDTGLLSAIDNISDELDESFRKRGYDIFSTRSDFLTANMKKLDDMGINSLDVVVQLDDMFKEFDAIRQGPIASMKSNKISQLSKAEKAKLENSFMRVVHDLHSSALLGQPSTSGLEIVSNTINNFTRPFANITGAKSLKDAVGIGRQRAWREYKGQIWAFNHSWNTFKKAYAKGKSVTDDFDVLDGAHATKIDYDKMVDEKQFVRYALVRLYKFAADISIAASESQKAMRAYGMAYSDGMELSLKSGMKHSEAKAKGLEYAKSVFDENGAITDLALKMDVQRTSWQAVIDSRYATGKGAQVIENLRNSTNPLVSTMARATIPFFRTLVNIGGDAAQTVMPPGLPMALRALKKTKLGKHAVMSARFLDDFTGTNGQRALVRAQSRQRMGTAIIGSTMALLNSGAITITPMGGLQSWDAKMAQWETAPGSSLIIGDTSIDLTRFLPFSAPLLFAGTLHDAQRQARLEMKDGEYVGPADQDSFLATYMSALGTLSYSLMSDTGSMRGIGELFEAVNKAVSEQDIRPMNKLGENYLKQFMPGLPRAVGKNTGLIDGDWDMYRGEGFLEEALASAGYKYGYKRLDFLGKPVQDPYRGLDFTNAKKSKVRSDILYNEYAKLNRDSELAMSLPTPDRVFDANFWKRIGKNSSNIEWLFREEAPSLNKLKLQDGRNAYDTYRDIVYKGKAARDVTKSTGSFGDRNSVGSVKVLQGETMEEALRRYVSAPVYQQMNPDGREKVWKAIFSIYKKAAKDTIAAEPKLAVPELFEDNKWGNPISEPTSIAETAKKGKALASEVQKTSGYPTNLDEIFAIE